MITAEARKNASIDRIAQIVMEHIEFSDRNPDEFLRIRESYGLSISAALGIGIATEITEIFDLTEKPV